MGARGAGMSGATAAMPGDAWALFANPADMSSKNEASFYVMRNFGLSALTDYAFELSHHTKAVTIGLAGHTYGFKLFRQSEFRVGINKSILNIRFGLAVNYINYSLPEPYGSAGTMGVNLGLAAPLAKGLWLGAWAENINQPEIGKNKEELPQALAIGFSYRITSKALYLLECYKDIDFPVSIRSGLEFSPVGVLRLRAGIKTHPESFSLGLGIEQKGFRIDFAAVHHMILGWSPGVDFAVQW